MCLRGIYQRGSFFGCWIVLCCDGWWALTGNGVNASAYGSGFYTLLRSALICIGFWGHLLE